MIFEVDFKMTYQLKKHKLYHSMKHIIKTVSLLFILSNNSFAQNSNLIMFSENGERFIAILNGLRQNDKHETNVKVTGLNAPNYKLKVIFEDIALGQPNFNVFLEPSTEATYVLKKNKKNEYVVRLMSSVPINEAPPVSPQTTVVVFNPSAPAYIEPAPVSNTEMVIQQTTVTSTSGGSAPATGGSISMGVNISETGGGFSMNVSGFEGNGNVSSQNSSVTTTTTTTTTTSAPPPPAPRPAPVVYVSGYSGPIGCPMPLLPNEFESLKSSINSKTFEDSKMTLAKQATGSACLTAHQVKDIMLLFTFEDNRLEFAKYAYGRTYDLGNYYKVNDAFTFELTIDELNEYINSRR
jgi:hypothetical protein